MRGPKLIITIIFLFCGGVSLASAQQGAGGGVIQRELLRGLDGMAVIVAGDERPGLSMNQLQTEVEQRLRKAGIKILDTKKHESENAPALCVFVRIVGAETASAYYINITLRERAKLWRNPSFNPWTEIWQYGVLGLISPSDIKELRETVDNKVDKFIADYLAANPK